MATAKAPAVPDPKEQFFKYFQLEATALQDQMAKLESLPNVGGERLDAIEHCLAGIARLQKEVQDASSYVPSYDQRIYSEGIKGLHEKLDEIRASLAPKSRFSFKSTVKKNDSAISLSDAAELAMQQRAKLFRGNKDGVSSAESSLAPTPANPSTPPDECLVRPPEPDRRGSLGSFLKAAGVQTAKDGSDASSKVRQMSFAASKSVSLSSHSGVHIILPSSAAHATSSGSLTNIRGCIVDMSIPTATGQPFAGLSIKNVKQSLLICGNVSGAAHITAVDQSVLVVATRQFRMHECRDCIVYLRAISQPIIEDCHNVQFAPLPDTYSPNTQDLATGSDHWDQVQDFNWLKSEPSPNWNILPAEQRLSKEVWKDISADNVNKPLSDMLNSVGISTLGQRTTSDV